MGPRLLPWSVSISENIKFATEYQSLCFLYLVRRAPVHTTLTGALTLFLITSCKKYTFKNRYGKIGQELFKNVK